MLTLTYMTVVILTTPLVYLQEQFALPTHKEEQHGQRE